jgi:predicted transcriptional regulator
LQENFQTISEFNRRTDALCALTGLNLSEIHGLLGISKAMVFAYRGGKNPITQKVWLKLKAAEEKAANTSELKRENAKSSADAKNPGIGESAHDECANLPRDDLRPYGGKASDGQRPPLQERAMEERVARLERIIEGLQHALKEL